MFITGNEVKKTFSAVLDCLVASELESHRPVDMASFRISNAIRIYFSSHIAVFARPGRSIRTTKVAKVCVALTLFLIRFPTKRSHMYDHRHEKGAMGHACSQTIIRPYIGSRALRRLRSSKKQVSPISRPYSS